MTSHSRRKSRFSDAGLLHCRALSSLMIAIINLAEPLNGCTRFSYPDTGSRVVFETCDVSAALSSKPCCTRNSLHWTECQNPMLTLDWPQTFDLA